MIWMNCVSGSETNLGLCQDEGIYINNYIYN